jgi:hypothetical protein
MSLASWIGIPLARWQAAEKTATPTAFLLGGLVCLWPFGRQNPLDGCFHGHSGLIKQSDDVLNRVASLASLTNEQPHSSCFLSQLMGVNLLERSFLVFFVVHGGERIQISPRVSRFLATHFLRHVGHTLREFPEPPE